MTSSRAILKLTGYALFTKPAAHRVLCSDVALRESSDLCWGRQALVEVHDRTLNKEQQDALSFCLKFCQKIFVGIREGGVVIGCLGPVEPTGRRSPCTGYG